MNSKYYKSFSHIIFNKVVILLCILHGIYWSIHNDTLIYLRIHTQFGSIKIFIEVLQYIDASQYCNDKTNSANYT